MRRRSLEAREVTTRIPMGDREVGGCDLSTMVRAGRYHGGVGDDAPVYVDTGE